MAKKKQAASAEHIKNRERVQTAEGFKRSQKKLREEKKAGSKKKK